MKDVFHNIKTLGVFLFVLTVGYLLGGYSTLFAQENQLPEWHILRFLQSPELKKDPHYAQPVILINPFTVPPGEEETFIKKFAEISELFKSTPGFINAKLHHSINPAAPYAFINVARWESLAAFKSAVTSPEFREIHKDFQYEGKASLYAVVKEYEGTAK